MRTGSGKAVLELIGFFKLLKALLLFALAAGLFNLLVTDIEATLTSFVERLHVDPHNHFFRLFLTHVLGLSPKLPLFVVGFIVYGAIFLVEGIGLLRRKHWAEYFTVIVTGSFLPLEIYEFVSHAHVLKAVVIALNVAIVVYLVWRLKRESVERHLRYEPAGAH
jgi:uncharacterized membrane protein (DUF2068 family)